MDDDPLSEDPEATVRRILDEWNADPANQQMMARIAERTAWLREKYEGVDVATLNEADWQEWLSVHHIFERNKAKGRRQNHRHAQKVAAGRR